MTGYRFTLFCIALLGCQLCTGMEKARIRFEESPTLTQTGNTIHFAYTVMQKYGDWLIIDPCEFTAYAPVKSGDRILEGTEFLSGTAMINARILGYDFTIAEPGEYQVWMHAKFPRRANYNHAEKMDDASVRVVSDSTNPAIRSKFAKAGATEAIQADAYLAPNAWHWIANFRYHLPKGPHRWRWPSPSAWCGGCIFDRIVLIRTGSNMRPENATTHNRELRGCTKGSIQSRRIKLKRIAAWEFDYEGDEGQGNIHVEYSYGGNQWNALTKGKRYVTPQASSDDYLFLRILCRNALQGKRSPVIYSYTFSVEKRVVRKTDF